MGYPKTPEEFMELPEMGFTIEKIGNTYIPKLPEARAFLVERDMILSCSDNDGFWQLCHGVDGKWYRIRT